MSRARCARRPRAMAVPIGGTVHGTIEWYSHATPLFPARKDLGYSFHSVSRSESRIMRPRIHAAARRRDRRQILVGACCIPVSYLNVAHFCRGSVTELRSIEAVPRTPTKVCQVQVANFKISAPNVPNKGARRGAKCASAAHKGGAPLGFQPVHT